MMLIAMAMLMVVVLLPLPLVLLLSLLLAARILLQHRGHPKTNGHRNQEQLRIMIGRT
jgi:hypothetical protein